MATFAGEVEVTVVPDTSGFGQRLEADTISVATRAAEKIGRAMGQVIADRVANGVRAGLDRVGASAAGAKAGAEFGRTFGNSANAEIKKTLKDQQQVRVRVLADTAKARAEIDQFARSAGERLGEKVADGLSGGASEGGRRASEKAPKAGEEYGGKFAAALKSRLEVALKSLPDVKLDADSGPVDRAIAGIREELQTLSGKRIGIDISTSEAIAKVDRLKARLDELARKSPDIRVRVDTGAAAAELAAFKASVGSVGSSASASIPAVGGLVMAVLALGPALVPITAASVGAFAGLAMGAMAAAGAVGVLVLALWPVIQAVAAVTQAQDKQASTASTAASRAYQLATAHDALRSAQESVAEAIRRGQQDQERATRAIERARRAERDAADAVLEAEQRLADARAEWSQDQEDLQSRILQGAIDQRQATLDLSRAEEDLKKVMADPSASAADREQAQINYEQAKKHLQDIQVENGKLLEEQKKNAQEGVEGSKKVKDAQQGVVDAKRNQLDAEQEVRDAVVAAAESQRQSARSVAQAQQRVIQAQRDLAQASSQAGAAGSSSLQTMQDKMAALTPEGRNFVLFLTGPMKTALGDLSAEAQRGFLPGLQSGLTSLLPLLPGLNRFVGMLAKTMGNLAAEAGKALGGPWWRQFFTFVGQTAGPVLQMMGRTLGNFLQGLAGLFQAMAPAAMQFGRGLLSMSEGFAAFGRSAGQSEQFQGFMAYLQQAGPRVMEFLRAFWDALVTIGRALAPVGMIVLSVATAIADFIARMDPTVIRIIGAAFLVVAAAIAAVNASMWLMAANPVVLVIAAIVVLLIALGAALYETYQKNETFRNAVNAAWDAIKTAVLWTWTNVLKPAFEWISNFVMTELVPAFMWLWQNVIVPAWAGIQTIISAAWAVIQVVWAEIKWYLDNILGPVFTWLYETVIKPAWDGIQTGISAAWTDIKVIWAEIKSHLETILGPVFTWLNEKVVQPAWNNMRTAIELAWSFIQVVWAAIKSYLENVLGPAFNWLYDNVVAPLWDNIFSKIDTVWERFIKPVFEALGSFIKTDVEPAFREGVDAIGAAWAAVVDVAKTPVEFIVDTVINKGIIGTWNKIASWFGVAPVETIDLPWGKSPAKPEAPSGGPNRARALASGGPVWGPGTGTSDSIPAWLSNGEYVIPAEIVKRLGVGFFDLIRSGRVDIAGDPSSLVVRRYADGGAVEATKAWLPSVDPLPYVWGGVGPNGYDCSGLSGEVWNRVTGRPSYRRVFTTNTLLENPGRFGLKPGRGLLTFGVSDTHMDGNLAGLGFEAKGRAYGILVGDSARKTSTFPHEFFLDSLGGSHDEAGGIGIDPLHPIESIKAMFAAVLSPLSKIAGTPFGALVSAMPRQAVDAAVAMLSGAWATKQALKHLVPHLADGGLVGRPTLYDQGGWLQPGLTTVLNASGSPEPVFTGSQWDRLSQGGLVDNRPNLSVQVHNPVPETASESTTRMMRRLGYARPEPNRVGV